MSIGISAKQLIISLTFIKMKKSRNFFVPLIITIISMLLVLGNIVSNLISSELEGEIKSAFGNNYRLTLILLFLAFTLISGYFTWFQWMQEKNSKGDSISFVHQLPELVTNFTGRKELLQDLERQYKNSRTNIFGIHGMGGIGKTTLATAFAHEIAGNFEAHFFINMQGLSNKAYSTTDAMLHIVRSFHPMFSFSDDDLVIAAYRTILNTKNILIILDNIKNEAQVKELIPSRNSVLIFTSREYFHRKDFYDIKLPLMSADEASQLLYKITDRIDSNQANRIAELCGYLPNALVKAGNSIREYPVLDVGNYIEQLRLAKIRVGLNDASANLSYNLLTEQLKVAWRELSIFPQSFGLEAASHILYIDYATCEKILFDLVKLSLINVTVVNSKLEREDISGARLVENNGEDMSETRFIYHDLDRLFANSLMKDNERKGVEFRFADYYRVVMKNMTLLYLVGGKDQLVAFVIFNKEWLNIQKGQFLSEKYIDANKQMEDICFEYSVNCLDFIDLHLSYNVIVNWSKTALKIARKRKSLPEEASALNNLGTGYYHMGNPDMGIPLLMQSFEIWNKLDDTRRKSDPLANLGNAYRKKGDLEKALEYHFASLKIGEELKDDSIRSAQANNIGNVYLQQNDPKNSTYYHNLSLELAKKNGYLVTEASSILGLAVAYAMQNKIIKFIQYNNLAVKLAQKLGAPRLINQAAENFENIFSQMKLGFVGKWYASKIRKGV